jgi:hypothetical protein
MGETEAADKKRSDDEKAIEAAGEEGQKVKSFSNQIALNHTFLYHL